MIKIPMEFKIKIKLQRIIIFEVPKIFIQLCFAVTFKRIPNFFYKLFPEFRIRKNKFTDQTVDFATCVDKTGKRYNIELGNIRGFEDDFEK